MSFEELKEAFLRELAGRGRAWGTMRGETTRLQQFIDFCKAQGLTRLSEVKLDQVVAYKKHLSQYSPLSRYAKVGTVRRWLSWAHHRDHLMWNPVADWSYKHPPQRIYWVPTERQMVKVLNTEQPESARRFLLEFLYGTGLRVQECADVDLEDLDLVQSQLTVRKGKNGKPRVMPLGPMLCALARHYLEKVRPQSASKALFLNEKGTRMNANTISKWIHRAGKACKFAKFTVHSIRKAFATHLIQAGAPLPAVKELLGHDCYRSTQLYLQTVVQDLEEMISVSHPRAHRKSTKPPRTDKL
ncbi:MAG: tyrosine-type recombinase/integrase [Candidatus Eremiobacteraeota bacterium]|nr:tyrosine-type recombinase/integrase [Candidatus Eremiobacteraeota bacterium]